MKKSLAILAALAISTVSQGAVPQRLHMQRTFSPVERAEMMKKKLLGSGLIFDLHNAPVMLNKSEKGMKKEIVSNEEPSGMISGEWGVLNDKGGKLWFYTQNINYAYTKSTVTMYNPNCDEVAKINIIPDFEKDVTINQIMPYGTLTNTFFDNDPSTTEMLVFIHGYKHVEETNEYLQYHELAAYNFEGKKVWSNKEASDAELIIYGNGQQRLLLHETEVINPAITKSWQKHDIFHMMAPAKDENGIVEEHVNFVQSDLFYYGEGPMFASFTIDNKPYYVIPHFEKMYATLPDRDKIGDDGYILDEDITVTPDNHFVVEVYDGMTYEKAAELKVSTNAPEGFLYRFPAFGMFSYNDLSKGTFSGDDKLNFVITYADYSIALDGDLTTYVAYNQDGKELLQICDSVMLSQKMADIPGQEEQYMFLRLTDGTQEMVMINVPSGEDVATFGATAGSTTGGMMQSSTFIDRYPVGNSYHYCMGMNEGTIDDENNVVSYYGWFKTDSELDHWVQSSLAPGIAMFTPLVTGETLNPHLLISDDQHEYMQIVKQETPNGGYEDVMYITNDNGEKLYTFKGNSQLGVLSQASIISNGDTKQLLLGYWRWDDAKEMTSYTLVLFDLPLDGTHDPDGILNVEADKGANGAHMGKVYDLSGIPSAEGFGNIRIVNGKKYLVK